MSLAKQFCFLKLLKVIKAKTKDRFKPGKFLDEANVKFTNTVNKEFKFWRPDLELAMMDFSCGYGQCEIYNTPNNEIKHGAITQKKLAMRLQRIRQILVLYRF